MKEVILEWKLKLVLVTSLSEEGKKGEEKKDRKRSAINDKLMIVSEMEEDYEEVTSVEIEIDTFHLSLRKKKKRRRRNRR